MNKIVIAEWLNGSQRSQDGIGINMSTRGRSVNCFEQSQGPRYIRMHLYL